MNMQGPLFLKDQAFPAHGSGAEPSGQGLYAVVYLPVRKASLLGASPGRWRHVLSMADFLTVLLSLSSEPAAERKGA